MSSRFQIDQEVLAGASTMNGLAEPVSARVFGYRQRRRGLAHDHCAMRRPSRAGRLPRRRGLDFGQFGHGWEYRGRLIRP